LALFLSNPVSAPLPFATRTTHCDRQATN
jgi:hypothetical protein